MDVAAEALHGGRVCVAFTDSEGGSFGQRLERVTADPFLIAFRIDPTFSLDFMGDLSDLVLFVEGDFVLDALSD